MILFDLASRADVYPLVLVLPLLLAPAALEPRSSHSCGCREPLPGLL